MTAAQRDGGFKVGDRVRIREGWGDRDFYPDGATGTVSEVCANYYWVKFDADSGAKARVNGDRTWCADLCRLEPAARTEQPE